MSLLPAVAWEGIEEVEEGGGGKGMNALRPWFQRAKTQHPTQLTEPVPVPVPVRRACGGEWAS